MDGVELYEYSPTSLNYNQIKIVLKKHRHNIPDRLWTYYPKISHNPLCD